MPTNGLANRPTNGLANGSTNRPTNGPANGPTSGPTNGPTNELANGLFNGMAYRLANGDMKHSRFLGATKHLYNWLCPLVGLLVCNAFVRRSTRRTLLANLALFCFTRGTYVLF